MYLLEMQNAFSEIKHSQNSYFTLTAQRSTSIILHKMRKNHDSIYDKYLPSIAQTIHE